MKVIVGLGATGLSVAKLFLREKVSFAVMDTRPIPPKFNEFQALNSNAPCSFGQLNPQWISQAEVLLVSPGYGLNGLPADKICSDIQLFSQRAQAPVVGITGTNGKSTVTTLFAQMCQRSGKNVLVGGNIGTPALDLLSLPVPDLYVLELSSFQLALTASLKTFASVILNITEDHLNWHGSMDAYVAAKHAIFTGTQCAVLNKSDALLVLPAPEKNTIYYDTSNAPKGRAFGLRNNRITFEGREIFDMASCHYVGAHFAQNVLAALSLGLALDLPVSIMLESVRSFTGLPYRTQLIDTIAGVAWINDSKATNFASMLAAIDSVKRRTRGNIILIAGGSNKGACLERLALPLDKSVSQVILLGETRHMLERALKAYTKVELVDSMHQAVLLAATLARSGDTVLLSPGCASFDMYNGFEQRGEHYNFCIKEKA